MTTRQNIKVYQGETFEFEFDALLDENGDPIDLTAGYVAKMQVRISPKRDTILAEFTDGNGLTLASTGVVTLKIDADETLTYNWKIASYDIRLTDPNDVEYVFFGTFEVVPNVTREPGVFDPTILVPGQPKILTKIETDEALVTGNVVAINSNGHVSLASSTGLTDPIGISAGSYSVGELADVCLFHGTITPILMDSAPSAAEQGTPIYLADTSGVGTMSAPGSGEQIEIAILYAADGSDTTPDAVFLGTGGGGGGGGGAVEDFSDIAARDSSNPDLVYAGWKANSGTTTSDPEWKISRLQISTDTTLFADGDELYDNIWDNRESLTYS